jgi:hypothetical protein
MARTNSKPAYGPNNPHSLSTRNTELVWEGKYDVCGNQRGYPFVIENRDRRSIAKEASA